MSKRKENYLQKLKEEYKIAIHNAHDKEGTKLQNYKKKIVKDGCFHPRSERVELDRECGSSNERVREDYEECQLCKKRWLMETTRIC